MDIELVVFDLAGTTVKDNNDVPRILLNSLAEHGVEITMEDAALVMGIPKPVAIEELIRKRYNGTRELTASWIDEIHELFVNRMIEFYQQYPFVEEKEGVSETFRRLRHAGVQIYVDTGFDRKITNPLLERMGWIRNNLIDGSITSDEVKSGRPNPDMIFRAMELSGITDINKVAKVGDTISDLQEGQRAGCRYVIGVTSGAQSAALLMKEYHTHLVQNLEEVVPILTN